MNHSWKDNTRIQQEFEKMEANHAQLVRAAYNWVLKNGSCGFAFRELKSLADEIPDVIGFGSSGHSVLIECKASRSDFLCDRSKPFRVNPSLGMGSQRFYCCPSGLIRKEELPERWGLLYVNDGKARVVHSPYHGNIGLREPNHEKSIKAEMDILYTALRRLHLRNRIEEIYNEP